MTWRRYPLQLLIGSALTSAATGFGVIQAIQGRLWWLLAPVVAFTLLGLEFWRLVRREGRDEQLARIVDLNELDNGVDLSLIDLHRWADAGNDPRWRCDLEDDTGERR